MSAGSVCSRVAPCSLPTHTLPSHESFIPTLDLIFWLTCKISVLLWPPREPLMGKGAFSQLNHPFYIRSTRYHLCPSDRMGPHSAEYQVLKGSNILICGIVLLPVTPPPCPGLSLGTYPKNDKGRLHNASAMMMTRIQI